MEVIHTPAPDTKAARLLASAVAAVSDKPVLLLLSGGSWIPALRHFDHNVLSPRVTIGMLDERFHRATTVNNYAQLKASVFHTRATAAGVAWFDTEVIEGETMADYAARYTAFISDWLTAHPDGYLMGTFGMGTDGHTAGVMPGFVHECGGTSDIVQAYSVPATVNEFPDRVTTTPCLWRRFDTAIALVAGEGKCPSLRFALQCKDDCEQYPAALWHRVPRFTVVTNC